MSLDYRVTPVFIDLYETLGDDRVAVVDQAVLRLMDDHQSAWAREGRVQGETGAAWIIELRTPDADIALYWNYLEDELILLAALVVNDA